MSNEPKCRWCGWEGPYSPFARVHPSATANETEVKEHERSCAIGDRIVANARAALVGLLAQGSLASFRQPMDVTGDAYEMALALEKRHMRGVEG